MKTIEYIITVEIDDEFLSKNASGLIQASLNNEFVDVIERYNLRCHIEMSEVKPDSEVCNEKNESLSN